jgi:hypothetical protein
MGVKVVAALVAVLLLGAYLLALVFKMKEIDLSIVVAVGLVLMLVDLWQSLKSKDD